MNKYASDDESGKVYKKYFEDVKKAIGSDKINFKDNDQIKNLMKEITTVENESNSVPPALYYKEEERILLVTKKSGNRERCRMLS